MRIPMTSGFAVLPEGHVILKVTNVEAKENFGKVKVYFETADGGKHNEQYNLVNDKGEAVNGAMVAISILAQNLRVPVDAEGCFNPMDFVGRYIGGDIEHTQSTNGKTYAHLRNTEPADGFEGEAPAEASATGSMDLNALLGM